MNPDVHLAKHTLHDIAVHAYNLAIGLQNIAPAQSNPGASVQYLKDISLELEKVSKQLDEL